jgi:hypothetical protein
MSSWYEDTDPSTDSPLFGSLSAIYSFSPRSRGCRFIPGDLFRVWAPTASTSVLPGELPEYTLIHVEKYNLESRSSHRAGLDKASSFFSYLFARLASGGIRIGLTGSLLIGSVSEIAQRH